MEAENVQVLPWPAYSPDMSPIEHVWDALYRRVQHRVPVLANIQQLRTAIEKEWNNIPQTTINSLINSMRRRYVVLHEANGGHTRYWLVFWSMPLPFFNGICIQQMHIYIRSHVQSIDKGIMILFQWTIIEMNCKSVKSWKLLHVRSVYIGLSSIMLMMYDL